MTPFKRFLFSRVFTGLTLVQLVPLVGATTQTPLIAMRPTDRMGPTNG